MAERSVQHELSFGSEPIVLVGEPRRCAGVLHIHNPQKAPVRLRRLRLRASGSLVAACEHGAGLTLTAPTSLCEGQTLMRRVTLRLPPSTPPGCYEAQLDAAAGVSHAVSIHVLERHDTRLSPGALSHAAQAGATFAFTLVVSNHGNVPDEIPTRAALELHDAEVGWPQHFHSAAKSHGDEGHAAFLDAFVKKLGQAEPPLGRVKVTMGAGALAPNQARALSLEVSLPKSLHASRAYRARVRLGGARLSVKLYLGAADETSTAAG